MIFVNSYQAPVAIIKGIEAEHDLVVCILEGIPLHY